jgi:ABC-type Mn2+/Zn2+ transport system ATPase subunit
MKAQRQLRELVTVESLDVGYGGKAVLRDVCFRLREAEHVGVVGPNGAGKTTLFHALAGLLEPLAGRIRFEVDGLELSLLPQRSEVDWRFPVTAFDVAMMGRVAKLGFLGRPGQSEVELVKQSLARVGLGALAGRRIGELSAGQQQRVFIARALAQEAGLILMDEPYTGLDAAGRLALDDILELLKGDSVTVLTATHNPGRALGRFDRVFYVDHNTVTVGSVHELVPARQQVGGESW